MKLIRFWTPVVLWMIIIFVLSSQQKITITDSYTLSFILFKTIHVIEYAFLFTVTYRAIINTMVRKGKLPLVIAFIITALYAISDEYHQSFVPTREGRLRDAIIDIAGAAIAWISIKQLLPKAPGRLKTLVKHWHMM
ncbi:MAG: VanZ family protein [Candidatus Gottesmanbacteria bacterium]